MIPPNPDSTVDVSSKQWISEHTVERNAQILRTLPPKQITPRIGFGFCACITVMIDGGNDIAVRGETMAHP